MKTISVETTTRRQVDDIIKFIKIAAEEMSTEGKQVLWLEIGKMFKSEIEQLRLTKSAT